MSIRKLESTGLADASVAFDSRLDQIEHVRSVLWAMKSLLGNEGSTLMSARSTHFELRVLAAVGLRLIDDLIDDMRCHQ